MPQIPEGTGHRSQRDMINSCSHAQWPWPGPCGEEPLYHRHHTHVWAKQDDFAIHLQGPQGGRKTTVRRSNARRDAPRQVGFAHRKRDIAPSLRVHASYHNRPWNAQNQALRPSDDYHSWEKTTCGHRKHDLPHTAHQANNVYHGGSAFSKGQIALGANFLSPCARWV